MRILLFSSQVVYGHVGAQAAVFPLQLLGHEVWHLPTVLFSNHPKHGQHRGEPVSGGRLAALCEGLEAIGVLARVDAVLSGYLGTADAAALVADTVTHLRRGRPDLLYCCDPVLGDDGRVYVATDLIAKMRERLAPMADLLTPNRFELGLLAESEIREPESALAAARRLAGDGRRAVACTSIIETERTIGTALVQGGEAWRAETPRYLPAPQGTGDLFAALLLGHHLNGIELAEALGRAASSVAAVVRESVRLGRDELALVQARAQIERPPPVHALQRQSLDPWR